MKSSVYFREHLLPSIKKLNFLILLMNSNVASVDDFSWLIMIRLCLRATISLFIEILTSLTAEKNT